MSPTHRVTSVLAALLFVVAGCSPDISHWPELLNDPLGDQWRVTFDDDAGQQWTVARDGEAQQVTVRADTLEVQVRNVEDRGYVGIIRDDDTQWEALPARSEPVDLLVGALASTYSSSILTATEPDQVTAGVNLDPLARALGHLTGDSPDPPTPSGTLTATLTLTDGQLDTVIFDVADGHWTHQVTVGPTGIDAPDATVGTSDLLADAVGTLGGAAAQTPPNDESIVAELVRTLELLRTAQAEQFAATGQFATRPGTLPVPIGDQIAVSICTTATDYGIEARHRSGIATRFISLQAGVVEDGDGLPCRPSPPDGTSE